MRYIVVDGNEAAARVAYALSDVIAIYPITPSSPMGELSDAWAAAGKKNLWGSVPRVVQMQSEAGAAGAVHGALQGGAMATTFTSSQGLLLMIPNMYKIAGELTPAVFHIAARSVAAQALSIFGDHSDVMSVRQTGWGMLFAGSVQEAMDFALIAYMSTLKARVPFLHIFDGFRTSHEIAKIAEVGEEEIRALIDEELVEAHRLRGLSPERPVIRGTAQNPDVFFQARESVNPFYLATPAIVEDAMDRFARLTGRVYHLFDYAGHPEAERVILLMGSGAETAEETAQFLAARGERVGVVKVRLFRPFSAEHLLKALPPTVKAIAVLDRTKEPGAEGEPLYKDVVTALAEGAASGKFPFGRMPTVVGGRYGLSSKEFTPAMVKGIFDELRKESPKNHFTVGIVDDLTFSHLEYDPSFRIEAKEGVEAIFWGLGSDGTVSANKNSIKIIGEETPYYVQGYFVYDSKKSGTVTTSHLRFRPEPIKSAYKVQQADFVAVHQFSFVERYDVLEGVRDGAVFLLNAPYGKDEVWDRLPRRLQEQIIEKKIKLWAVNASEVARQAGLGRRINTVMQTCFFAISGVLPRDEAIRRIKQGIEKSYGRKGRDVVEANFRAVDEALANLHEIPVPAQPTSDGAMRPPVQEGAPDFVREVLGAILAGRGDELPVSALPCDGTYPVGTARFEKRNIAEEVPVWDPDLCIQCGKCVFVCPHAAVRAKVYDAALLEKAPAAFKSAPARWRGMESMRYTLQVAVEDCTGCSLCFEVCPVTAKDGSGRKALTMKPQEPLREQERQNWEFFLGLPEVSRTSSGLKFNNVKNVQLLEPLFEFSGACAGCGETPYLKLLSQLFGDRVVIANATGCSSIYGGNLPTTPWSANREGRGPAWCNSLFEDNAEFGLGIRLGLDAQAELARNLLRRYRGLVGEALAERLLSFDPSTDEGIEEQRRLVAELDRRLEALLSGPLSDQDAEALGKLRKVADALVKKSVWIVGGDGWAYDIGFGGLDHVLASGANVNILVLDTEVYSNTGGQASKATPRGAVAKFAAKGKRRPKKDLGAIARQYGAYVATVAMGADEAQTIKAFLEAEAFDGPSLIIAYAHCIAHGIPMEKGMEHQRLAVESGYWTLYRYNPAGDEPLTVDSKEPKLPLREFLRSELRFRSLEESDPDTAEALQRLAEEDARARRPLPVGR